MSPRRLDRRAFLALAGLAPLSGCILGGEPPLPHAKVRAVTLDVGPLVDKGLSNYAQKVEAMGRPALARAFADILAPNDRKAPTVTVSISEIHFSASPNGGGSDDTLGPGDEDAATGRLDVSAADGLPAFSRRLFATRSPADAGPWYLPDIDDRRLAKLLDLYAIWARREFPG